MSVAISVATIGMGGRDFTATYATISHPRKGHDRAACQDGFAGVADGATPLGDGWPDPGGFAGTALACLAAAAAEELPLRELWAAAITAAAGSPGAEQPFVSCSVAVARALDGEFEVSVLGDCTAIVERTDGRRVTLHDPTVPRLDAECARLDPAFRRACYERNRRRMNTPDAYWVFGTDPAAADHVLSVRLPAAEVAALVLYTDGFATGVDLAGGSSAVRGFEESVGRQAPPPFTDDATFLRLAPTRARP